MLPKHVPLMHYLAWSSIFNVLRWSLTFRSQKTPWHHRYFLLLIPVEEPWSNIGFLVLSLWIYYLIRLSTVRFMRPGMWFCYNSFHLHKTLLEGQFCGRYLHQCEAAGASPRYIHRAILHIRHPAMRSRRFHSQYLITDPSS